MGCIAEIHPKSIGQSAQKPLGIIIPCASYGHVKSYGLRSLLDIKEKPLLSHQIDTLKAIYPHSEVILGLGFEADKVAQQFAQYRSIENEFHADTSVTRTIGLALRACLHTSVLIVYGDVLFEPSALSSITAGGSAVLLDSRGQMRSTNIGAYITDGSVARMSYGCPSKFAQVIFITGKEYDLFKAICCDRTKSKLLGFEAINLVLEQGGHFRGVETEGYIGELSTGADLQRMRA